MLAFNCLLPPDTLLLLDDDAHGLRLGGNHDGAALKEALIDVRCALEREIAATKHAGAIEPQDVAGHHTLHPERQAEHVACSDEIELSMNMDRDIVSRLRGEEGRRSLTEGSSSEGESEPDVDACSVTAEESFLGEEGGSRDPLVESIAAETEEMELIMVVQPRLCHCSSHPLSR